MKHPIPSRTRQLSTVAPMVLRLKTWESRSPPNLVRTSQVSLSSMTLFFLPPPLGRFFRVLLWVKCRLQVPYPVIAPPQYLFWNQKSVQLRTAPHEIRPVRTRIRDVPLHQSRGSQRFGLSTTGRLIDQKSHSPVPEDADGFSESDCSMSSCAKRILTRSKRTKKFPATDLPTLVPQVWCDAGDPEQSSTSPAALCASQWHRPITPEKDAFSRSCSFGETPWRLLPPAKKEVRVSAHPVANAENHTQHPLKRASFRAV